MYSRFLLYNLNRLNRGSQFLARIILQIMAPKRMHNLPPRVSCVIREYIKPNRHAVSSGWVTLKTDDQRIPLFCKISSTV